MTTAQSDSTTPIDESAETSAKVGDGRDSRSSEHRNGTTLVGAVLGEKWRIVRHIGEGATANVYEAVHRNGKRGAVKILRRELCALREARERFEREGRMANEVAHRGIVASLDDDVTDEGIPYLVMELLEGETLDDRLESRPDGRLPPEEACRLGLSLLDVLAAVHAAGILHRDLKPDNIFLTTSGELKLLDFGIARAPEMDRQGTRLGIAMGTPGYMPVEQASGDWEHVDVRTDVWAAGAVLHRVLTGACVHDEETVAATLCAAMTRGATPIAHRVSNVPPLLASVVDRALQLHPADRWQTAAAMRDALELALVEIETAEQSDDGRDMASIPTFVTSNGPPMSRVHAWSAVLLVACVSVPVLGFVGVHVQQAHGRNEPLLLETAEAATLAASPPAASITLDPPPAPTEPEDEAPKATSASSIADAPKSPEGGRARSAPAPKPSPSATDWVFKARK